MDELVYWQTLMTRNLYPIDLATHMYVPILTTHFLTFECDPDQQECVCCACFWSPPPHQHSTPPSSRSPHSTPCPSTYFCSADWYLTRDQHLSDGRDIHSVISHQSSYHFGRGVCYAHVHCGSFWHRSKLAATLSSSDHLATEFCVRTDWMGTLVESVPASFCVFLFSAGLYEHVHGDIYQQDLCQGLENTLVFLCAIRGASDVRLWLTTCITTGWEIVTILLTFFLPLTRGTTDSLMDLTPPGSKIRIRPARDGAPRDSPQMRGLMRISAFCIWCLLCPSSKGVRR